MADDARIPRFELHIRPLMRLLDRDHMLAFALDLWDYDSVKASADDIIQFLQNGPMPPTSHGGPWPGEWITLFIRWRDAGCRRLGLGSASAGYTASRSGPLVSLVARGRVPSTGFGVWLNLERVTPDRREYTLVEEPPPEPVPGPDRPFTARERFESTSASLSLSVTDRDGIHEVPLQPSAFLHVLGPSQRVQQQLTAVGFSIDPADVVAGREATARRGPHLVRLTSDEMFTEVTGTPEALEAFQAHMGTRVRK